ncbi:LysE family translocator [Desulfopila sp. IMCC35008]|uniref:LysE family translocator n=1 Tax=Desulfopila sp. IMCC35008 TaxID=2653858 RepID=UPI0013D0AB29|nr:LysE family translocator [Desulfopila sp. IMCC35008]
MEALGIGNFYMFVTACLMLNLYPGPDTMYIIGRSVSQGRLAGVAAVLGITSGGMVHGVLGCFGLSAILAVSSKAFLALKLLGCCYLLYQAVQMFRTASQLADTEIRIQDHNSFFRIYRQGAVTNILNPKVALFFLAFIPQFISPAAANKPLAFLVLTVTFMTTGTLWCLVVALAASKVSSRMRSSKRCSQWLLRINGTLFAFLGLKLAMTDIQ